MLMIANARFSTTDSMAPSILKRLQILSSSRRTREAKVASCERQKTRILVEHAHVHHTERPSPLQLQDSLANEIYFREHCLHKPA
jgi:hypothetical protein